jgi:hypothetical protein
MLGRDATRRIPTTDTKKTRDKCGDRERKLRHEYPDGAPTPRDSAAVLLTAE